MQKNRTVRKQEDWKTGQPEKKKTGKQDSQKTRRLENRAARKQEDWKNDYLHSG